MTPELEAVWQELLERATRPPFAERARLLREAFAARCGRLEPDHPAAALRDAAAWEDAIVRGGLAREIAPELSDPAERATALDLERAQRGIFVFEEIEDQLIARDLWAGGEFLVLNRDSTGRELLAALRRSGTVICQARLVAQNPGCALLPGGVFHPEDARGAIEQILGAARGSRLATDDVLDGLLRMEHTFQTMSRAKIDYAYRDELLGR